MDDTSSDESVSQFLAITGSADAGQAKSYLEMSGNDLQTAISLFLEHQAAGPSGGGALGGSDSMMGSGQGAGPSGIRAPDETQRMQLVGGFDDGPAAAMGMGAGMMEHPLLRPGPRMNAFAEDYDMGITQELPGSLRDIMNRAAASADDEVQEVSPPHAHNNNGGAGSGRATRLSDMFAPPLHLIHSAGGFQGARNFAKDSKRWLLVNLQSDSDFACHALNRDVWRDELCENLIREGFVFWQSVSDLDS